MSKRAIPSRDELQARLNELRCEYGEWTYDIPLPFELWTRGNEGLPHTRLRRIVQIVSDLLGKPLCESRILDLGCLEGMFSIEFAQHGAETVGVEIRDASFQKAKFCQEALGLTNLEFRQDDVRNISVESFGRFDVIICSGILYHLTGEDAVRLIDRMHQIADRLVVIDTHISLVGTEPFDSGEEKFWGTSAREHAEDDTDEQKAQKLWASADNTTSFRFTRPSLINLLSRAGFSSVYECFTPAHLNYGQPGLEHEDRCTFVAVKDNICEITTSPAVNGLREQWPEGSLSYAAPESTESQDRSRFGRMISRLRHLGRRVGGPTS